LCGRLWLMRLWAHAMPVWDHVERRAAKPGCFMRRLTLGALCRRLVEAGEILSHECKEVLNGKAKASRDRLEAVQR
jgi:hypothetical protein